MTEYKICQRCVMDTSASDITFDPQGVCNFCAAMVDRVAKKIEPDLVAKRKSLEIFVDKVKRDGRGKTYDCVVGISGGADSAWTLYQAIQLGLRPLAIHMDNCWNSELANNNIETLVNGMNVDLDTHVIDWSEYRDLMNSFFKANVVDVELLYDNAMLSDNFRLARKVGAKYILSGDNVATEGIRMPQNWAWIKYDKKNILGIHRRFGSGEKLKTFFPIGTWDFLRYNYLHGIRWSHFLNYFDYQKAGAMETLRTKFGFKPYPYKHYESVFTRFYQGYILPEKFKIDKRRPHLSALIVSGQMSRDVALEKLTASPYPSPAELETDRDFFLKKMEWSRDDLNRYLAAPPVPHDAYPTEKPLWDFMLNGYRKFVAK